MEWIGSGGVRCRHGDRMRSQEHPPEDGAEHRRKLVFDFPVCQTRARGGTAADVVTG